MFHTRLLCLASFFLCFFSGCLLGFLADPCGLFLDLLRSALYFTGIDHFPDCLFLFLVILRLALRLRYDLVCDRADIASLSIITSVAEQSVLGICEICLIFAVINFFHFNLNIAV